MIFQGQTILSAPLMADNFHKGLFKLRKPVADPSMWDLMDRRCIASGCPQMQIISKDMWQSEAFSESRNYRLSWLNETFLNRRGIKNKHLGLQPELWFFTLFFSFNKHDLSTILEIEATTVNKTNVVPPSSLWTASLTDEKR